MDFHDVPRDWLQQCTIRAYNHHHIEVQPHFSTKADWFSKLLQGISEGPTVYKYKNWCHDECWAAWTGTLFLATAVTFVPQRVLKQWSVWEPHVPSGAEKGYCKTWESLNSYSKPKSCLCLRAWMILTVLCSLSAQSKMILWAVSLLENKSTWWWGRGPCSLRSFPYPDAMPQVSRLGATQIWKHHPLISFLRPNDPQRGQMENLTQDKSTRSRVAHVQSNFYVNWQQKLWDFRLSKLLMLLGSSGLDDLIKSNVFHPWVNLTELETAQANSRTGSNAATSCHPENAGSPWKIVRWLWMSRV